MIHGPLRCTVFVGLTIAATMCAGCGGGTPEPADAGCPSDAACVDAGGAPRDAGRDAGRDAATSRDGGTATTGTPGARCREDADCELGICLKGVVPDPSTLSCEPFREGYCIASFIVPVGATGGCDLDAPAGSDDGCGPVGRCVQMIGPPDTDATACFAACEPTATGSSCLPGYTCDFGYHACVTGCCDDMECRLYREDTDRNGLLDYGVDQLRYDGASAATCQLTTGRCTQPSAPGATAGIPCTRDSECQADGECLTLLGAGWPDGYCSKRGCDVAGRECEAASDVCMRGYEAMCMRGCHVGADAALDRLGPAGHGAGCRPGYQCLWNGIDDAGVENNGACVPGNYNDVATNNVGTACVATRPDDDPDARCYSPFGYGVCATPEPGVGVPALPSGLCTVRHCGAPGIDAAEACGPDAQCIAVGAQTECVKNCASPSECATGYACAAVSTSATAPHACVPDCAADADCTDDRRCLRWSGATTGRCVVR